MSADTRLKCMNLLNSTEAGQEAYKRTSSRRTREKSLPCNDKALELLGEDVSIMTSGAADWLIPSFYKFEREFKADDFDIKNLPSRTLETLSQAECLVWQREEANTIAMAAFPVEGEFPLPAISYTGGFFNSDDPCFRIAVSLHEALHLTTGVLHDGAESVAEKRPQDSIDRFTEYVAEQCRLSQH